ncbi:methyltransferase domain-containing protein [Natronorubrum sp. JWXQ-INN-674]|uniref:Methyltransferase domain-containing protein n=1 Tax=Natronorubrum halalkaliphilum TaxID=2691917 RepID=A0A6B0VR09_9EURY|nr:class I SAM-dependent methyltransferase [Natronorubrum halalkaliphilum]MXV63446.1 methyltransferase domain-containing protein [Natronorubrum halalkaliphilum]
MTGEDSRRANEHAPHATARSGERLPPVVRSFVDDHPAGRALDVATGTGRNALVLAERGWTVDAVDISSAQLTRARERAADRSVTVNWILADVDSYGFPDGVYDLVTVRFFDARNRLPALIASLAPGGVLWYEHYLESPAGESGPGDSYRFEPNELLTACSALTILYYAEYRVDGEPRVTLVARNEDDVSRWRPQLSPD